MPLAVHIISLAFSRQLYCCRTLIFQTNKHPHLFSWSNFQNMEKRKTEKENGIRDCMALYTRFHHRDDDDDYCFSVIVHALNFTVYAVIMKNSEFMKNRKFSSFSQVSVYWFCATSDEIKKSCENERNVDFYIHCVHPSHRSLCFAAKRTSECVDSLPLFVHNSCGTCSFVLVFCL